MAPLLPTPAPCTVIGSVVRFWPLTSSVPEVMVVPTALVAAQCGGTACYQRAAGDGHAAVVVHYAGNGQSAAAYAEQTLGGDVFYRQLPATYYIQHRAVPLMVMLLTVEPPN